MRRFLLVSLVSALCCTPLSGCASAGSRTADSAQADIQRELDAMLIAWNNDDLAAHVRPYAETATWTTSTGLLRGREAITQTLIKSFQRNGELLGELAFGKSEFTRLSDDVMMTNGSFSVTKLPSGKDINGQSTLIWKRVAGRWQIVHDHSS